MKPSKFILLSLLLITACTAQSSRADNAALPSTTAAVISVEPKTPTVSLATSSPTASPTPTQKPAETKSPTPAVSPATLTPSPSLTPVATICDPPARQDASEISPDGQWTAVQCEGKDGVVDSYLRVVSRPGGQVWTVRFADYAHGEKYDSQDKVYAFHWSHNGKYLYASALSRWEGCCWVGHEQLLVRLNLENGQQTEIVNYIGALSPVDFAFSSDDRYFLYIPQGDENLYIQDLHTWRKRTIKLDFKTSGAGYALMSHDNQKLILMLIEVSQNNQQWDQRGSIIIINLQNNAQRKLVSDMPFENIPVPIRWQDEDHVLLYRDDGYWLLNIHTGEIVETQNS